MVETGSQQLASLPNFVGEPLTPSVENSLANWADRNGLMELFTGLAERLRATLVRQPKIIEIAAPLPIEDFKSLFAVLVNMLYR
jgi:hypothetical protein